MTTIDRGRVRTEKSLPFDANRVEPHGHDDEPFVLADAHDARPLGQCPLCGLSSIAVDRFAFAPKPPLKAELALEYCGSCNFLYAGELSQRAYRRYYETVRNDGDHVILSGGADSHDRLQGSQIAAAVPPDFSGAVLDVGCGQGRLLNELADRFPQASLAGYDVANYLPVSSKIRFLDDIDGLDGRFDVVVLSHVVEHLVEFDLLTRVVDLLKPGGLLYLEVPNPFEYIACARREFMYYFDRLHVNHFGSRAIGKLLACHGLRVTRRGSHRFRYRDGHYPAAFYIATRSDRGVGADAPTAEDDPPLDAVYRSYRASESKRARAWREGLTVAAAEGILVYGAGDNFHRALWPDGPLHGLSILAVMDRRADELSGRAGFRYALPEAALAEFPSAPVVVTVSQGSEDIAAALRSLSPDRSISFV